MLKANRGVDLWPCSDWLGAVREPRFCSMLASLVAALVASASPESTTFIRVDQLGYLPDAPKVAVVCALDYANVRSFAVQNERGRTVLGPRRVMSSGAFGPCVGT